jgi:hypothetical protein
MKGCNFFVVEIQLGNFNPERIECPHGGQTGFGQCHLSTHYFWIFLKLFVNMRLALSFARKQKSYFLDLRIKSYRCLKFQGEVWAGRACVGANQQELITCTKSGGQEEKTFQEKWELPHRRRCRPVAGGRPLVAGWLRVDTCACGTVQSFLKFFYLKNNNFWKFG